MPADPSTADDLALLRRFQRGRDEAAFAELLRRHWPMVFGACRRTLGGDAARAEEAAQEVFTRLARKAFIFQTAWCSRAGCTAPRSTPAAP